MKELIKQLNFYRNEYYNNNNSIISDKEYDDLYDKLVKLEKETGIILSNSPTITVGYKVLDILPKVKHSHRMLSLDKTKQISDLINFKNCQDVVLTLKMDGLTLLLTYENGKLIQAETRGNGDVGSLVTDAAKCFENIPLEIPYKGHFEIEGEAIITFDNFTKINTNNQYKNQRNLASGTLSLLDTKEIEDRHLSFIGWRVITDIGKTYVERFNKAKNFGFDIVPFVENITANNIEFNIETLKDIAKIYGFPIDGIVMSYNNINYGLSLGETSHAPRHSIAYKFYDETYESELLDIEWTMGRTGQLTPVAILEPVELEGTTVSRASLHNVSILQDLFGSVVYKNQKVEIYKANQIIPQIKSVINKLSDCAVHIKEKIEIPKYCPICGGDTEIVQEIDSKILYCTNPQCEGRLINRIDHLLGKKGLDAKGVSKATIEKLIDWGWVTKLSDIFVLEQYREEWEKQTGFGPKSVSNIIQSIKESSNCNLESIISGAGIPLIGKTVAKELSTKFKTYTAFREACTGTFDFSSIDNFGYEMNKSIKSFNYTELDFIVENYLNIQEQEEKEQNVEMPLQDLIFCVTGKVKQVKNRDELKKIIEQHGGKVVDSISKNVKYLINNDSTSTSVKNKKAIELNIPIISEKEILEMCNGKN